ALVLGIKEREQETDRNRLHVVRRNRTHGLTQRRCIEWLQHVAAIINPFLHFPGEARRHQHGWLVVENIKNGGAVRARLLSDGIDAPKAFRYQESGTGAFFFQECIGPNRCPVAEIADLASLIRKQCLDARQDRARGFIRSRWKLGDGKLAARFIEIDKIRKRASGIDRDAVGSHSFSQFQGLGAGNVLRTSHIGAAKDNIECRKFRTNNTTLLRPTDWLSASWATSAVVSTSASWRNAAPMQMTRFLTSA